MVISLRVRSLRLKMIRNCGALFALAMVAWLPLMVSFPVIGEARWPTWCPLRR